MQILRNILCLLLAKKTYSNFNAEHNIQTYLWNTTTQNYF